MPAPWPAGFTVRDILTGESFTVVQYPLDIPPA